MNFVKQRGDHEKNVHQKDDQTENHIEDHRGP